MAADPADQFMSPYVGIGNDPVNYIDPDGEFAVLTLYNSNGDIMNPIYLYESVPNDLPTGGKFIFNGKGLFYIINGGIYWRTNAVSGRGIYRNNPKYQNIKNYGPIPNGKYYIKLQQGIPHEQLNNGEGWGRFAVKLRPTIRTTINTHKKFGGRGGFYLHEDGGVPGTAGCIGIEKGDESLATWELLKKLQQNGMKEVELEVDYEYEYNPMLDRNYSIPLKGAPSLRDIPQAEVIPDVNPSLLPFNTQDDWGNYTGPPDWAKPWNLFDWYWWYAKPSKENKDAPDKETGPPPVPEPPLISKLFP